MYVVKVGLSFWLFVLISFVQAEQNQVIVLANSNDPQSVELAEFYIEKRQLPRRNLVALPLPAQETITWGQFSSKLYNPLQTKLIEQGWMDASTANLLDEMGREQKVVFDHAIKYLVLCKGVPLRIKNDPSKIPTVLPAWLTKQFKRNNASVDSELAVLPQSGTATVAAINNPFFNTAEVSSWDRSKFIAVSRLDGPTYDIAKNLVEDALYAEEYGLIGRAYIDLHQHFPQGEKWIGACQQLLHDEGFDLSVDRRKALYPSYRRFDAPAFYFGWYSAKPAGVFLHTKQRFSRGAIAFHLHSFSAAQLKDSERSWVPHLLDRGAAVTFGNVYEPYLELTQRPHLFLQAILGGKEVGEAGMMATSHFSWQNVLIGDPLYRPMKTPLSSQLLVSRNRDEYPYALIRNANLLLEEKDGSNALTSLQNFYYKNKNLAVAFRIAQMAYERSQFQLAADRLQIFMEHKVTENTLGLYLEAAELSILIKKFEFSKKLLLKMVADSESHRSLINKTLRFSIRIAKKCKWENLVREWEEKLKNI